MQMTLLLLFCCCLAGASRWVIEFHTDEDAVAFAHAHGLIHVGALDQYDVPNLHLFREDTAHHSRWASRARDPPSVKWAEKQMPVRRVKREQEVFDPLFPIQWHLRGTGPSSIGVGPANVTGRGILIGMVDDGLQYTHPELSAAYDAAHSWNFNGGAGGLLDPSPRARNDGHGTSAAGVAVGARHNEHCGQGVAYGAKIAGLRLIAEPVADVDEAAALSKFSQDIDIYSCSWGPADTGRGLDAPGRLVRMALAQMTAGQARNGRNGKGSIYVWASGNGRDVGDSCAYDGYASNPYVNAIGAVDVNGKQAWYSEGCAGLMAVMPSSGAMQGIVTADLMGADGYDPSECTTTFGGTSAAAPMAAGVIALLLEQSGNTLTWRDVKHVIARGATMIDPTDAGWTTNAAGYHHNNKYGFGVLQIRPLLETLARYRPVPAHQIQLFSELITTGGSITTGGEGYVYAIQLETPTEHISFIETVVLSVSLSHPYRGHVEISLTSPSGTISVLAEKHGDFHANYPEDGWSFSSVRHWGETTANGTWTLRVRDAGGEGGGIIHWFRLGIFGY